MSFDLTDHVREFAHVLRYNPKSKSFLLGDLQLTLAQIGRALAYGLISGEKPMLSFQRMRHGSGVSYGVQFSVAYLQQMLEWVQRYGWFWDEVEGLTDRHNGDHAFDGTRITPGLHWDKVEKLQQIATALEAQSVFHAQQNELAMAEEIASLARQHRSTAERLLTLSLPNYSKRRPRRHY